jgi:hypothetical protein
LLGFSEERTRAKRKWRSWLSFKDPGMAFRKLSKYLRCQGNGTSANHLGREMDSRPNCKIQRPRKQWPKIWAIRLRQFFVFSEDPRVFCFEKDTSKTPQNRVSWHSLLLDEAAYKLSRWSWRRQTVKRQETSGEQTSRSSQAVDAENSGFLWRKVLENLQFTNCKNFWLEVMKEKRRGLSSINLMRFFVKTASLFLP